LSPSAAAKKLSLSGLTAIFSGGSGLAGTRMSPFSIYCRMMMMMMMMMEVMVTTGAIDVQSSSQIITTNKPTPRLFYKPDVLPVVQPTVSKH